MSSTIDIRIAASGEYGAIDIVNSKLDKLGESGHEASKGVLALSYAAGQFIGSAVLDLTKQLPQIVEQLYKMGVESLRAKAGFEAMGGSADAIAKMQAATHFLIDDTVALQMGTLALGAGVVKTTEDLTELARIGATLGVTFKGSAAEGVTAFTTALDSVGNVRALRTLGIDTLTVKTRFEELKKTMTDQEAWKMAVFEVAGANATKLAGNLEGAGTAVERLSVRFEDAKESLGEWVAEGVNKAATSLESLEKQWNILAANPDLTLTVVINQVNKGATSGLNDLNDALTKWLNDTAHGATINGQSGNVHPIGSPMTDQAPKIVPYGGDANSPEIGRDPYAGGGWQSPWQRNHAGPPIGGDQMYWQRRNAWNDSDTSSDITSLRPVAGRSMGDNALRGEYVTPTDTAQKQVRDLATVKSLLGDISGIAGDYNSKMLAVLAPLSEQQRILEKRKSIQSVDDAFGIQRDGLYGEIGGGMEGAIAEEKSQKEAELEKIGRRYGKNSKKYKAASAELEDFDASSKAAMDEYAIATGAATKESLKFRDQMNASKQAFLDGKISLTQYKNEMLLMAEAAKSGATSMGQLTEIQRHMNFNLHTGVTKTGKTAQSDASLAEQYTGGVKGTKSYAGADDPFDAVVDSANKAATAAAKIGTEGAKALGTIVTSGVLVVSKFGEMTSGADTALQKILKLQIELKTLASLSVNITSTTGGGGGGRSGTGRAGGVQGPPR